MIHNGDPPEPTPRELRIRLATLEGRVDEQSVKIGDLVERANNITVELVKRTDQLLARVEKLEETVADLRKSTETLAGHVAGMGGRIESVIDGAADIAGEFAGRLTVLEKRVNKLARKPVAAKLRREDIAVAALNGMLSTTASPSTAVRAATKAADLLISELDKGRG